MNKDIAEQILMTAIGEAYPVWSSVSYEKDYMEAINALNYILSLGDDKN